MITDEAKSLVRRYFEEVHNQRHPELIAEMFAPEVVSATQRAFTWLVTAFPDYQITLVEQVAEGDKVATVWRARGTHQGDWESPIGTIAATGKPIEWTGTTTLRVSDGRITGVIGSNHDHLGILQQMGSIPSHAPRSGA